MKIFKKILLIALIALITMQSMQLTIFANYAEITDILNGGNYDDIICTDETDDTAGYSNEDNTFDYPAASYNTPAFADLLVAQETADPVTRIKNLLDIDEATAAQMITVFGDAQSALDEALLYDSLRRVYYILDYDSVKDDLTSLVVNGYGAERVAQGLIFHMEKQP